jgi:hypothetical protein
MNSFFEVLNKIASYLYGKSMKGGSTPINDALFFTHVKKESYCLWHLYEDNDSKILIMKISKEQQL